MASKSSSGQSHSGTVSRPPTHPDSTCWLLSGIGDELGVWLRLCLHEPDLCERIPWRWPHRSVLSQGTHDPKSAVPADLAHTKYMREDKVPLCDRHHFRMWREQSSFLPTIGFKCASQNCRRYYGRRYGYFDLLPIVSTSLEQIDPANRCMKVCTRRQAHSYMAITRPKNTGSDAKDLWCWHSYECFNAK
jgi:hypothetical protein